MVLAAGAGRRLESLTDDLPKTLLPVDGDRTILDIALGNLAARGLETVVVVTGYAAERIEERRDGARASATALRDRDRLQPEGGGVEQRLLAVVRARALRRAACCCATATRCTRPRSRSGCWPAAAHAELVLALDDAKPLGEEEMKVLLDGDGLLRRASTRRTTRPTAAGEYIGLTLIEPAAAERLAEALRGDLASATRSSTTRTASRSTPTAAGASASPRSAGSSGSRSTTSRPRPGAGGRVALLTRMVGTPLTIDIGPGAVAGLAPLLADRRISSGGHVAIAVGPGQGEEIAEVAAPAARQRRHLDGRGRHRRGGHRAARAPALGLLRRRRRASAAARRSTPPSTPRRCPGCRWSRSPPRSPTTGSPRRSPRWRRAGARRSFGVQMPIAVVVDLDYVRRSDAGDAPLGDRRRRLQPRRRSPTGGWPSASAASRSTAWP